MPKHTSIKNIVKGFPDRYENWTNEMNSNLDIQNDLALGVLVHTFKVYAVNPVGLTTAYTQEAHVLTNNNLIVWHAGNSAWKTYAPILGLAVKVVNNGGAVASGGSTVSSFVYDGADWKSAVGGNIPITKVYGPTYTSDGPANADPTVIIPSGGYFNTVKVQPYIYDTDNGGYRTPAQYTEFFNLITSASDFTDFLALNRDKVHRACKLVSDITATIAITAPTNARQEYLISNVSEFTLTIPKNLIVFEDSSQVDDVVITPYSAVLLKAYKSIVTGFHYWLVANSASGSSSSSFKIITPFTPVLGQQVYYDVPTSSWTKGVANDELKLSSATVVKVINGSACLIAHAGVFNVPSHGFSNGYWWQSVATLAGVQATAPTNADHYNRPAFQVIDANTLFVLNSMRPIKVSDGALATVTVSAGAGDAGKVPKLDVNGAFDASFFNAKPAMTFSKTTNQTISNGVYTAVAWDSKASFRGFDAYFTSALSGTHLTALKACTFFVQIKNNIGTATTPAGMIYIETRIDKGANAVGFATRSFYNPATAGAIQGAIQGDIQTNCFISCAIGDVISLKGFMLGASSGISINSGSYAEVYIL